MKVVLKRHSSFKFMSNDIVLSTIISYIWLEIIGWFVYESVRYPITQSVSLLSSQSVTMKTEGSHHANFVVAGGTAGCRYDSMWRLRWCRDNARFLA